MLNHSNVVRSQRTFVKGVENVPRLCDDAYMPVSEHTGRALHELKQRAGLTLEQIADLAGYKGKSSVQEYFKEDYEGALSPRVATRLALALAGRGNPAIEPDEVMALVAYLPPANAVRQPPFEGASLERLREDLPVYGSALGAERTVEGEAVEQTELNTGSVIRYVRRPAILNTVEKAYGLYVQGSSMEPRFDDGDLIIAQRTPFVRVGDYVVVYLRANGDDDDGERSRMVMVKRLVRRTAQYVELEQFNPPLRFKVAGVDVVNTDRILSLEEMLA